MSSEKMVRCDFCGGRGEYVCPSCGGQIHVGGTTQIPNPNGPPGSWTRCPRCEGIGMVICPKCHGSGQVSSRV